ncbi:MAG: eCIS core domain-containing protein [Janthinobacterium lividum]
MNTKEIALDTGIAAATVIAPGLVAAVGIGYVGAKALNQGQAILDHHSVPKDGKAHFGGGLTYNILHKYKKLGWLAGLQDKYDQKNEAGAKFEYDTAVSDYQGLEKSPLLDVWGTMCLSGSEILDAGSNFASLMSFAMELLGVAAIAAAFGTLGATAPIGIGVEEMGKTFSLLSDGLGVRAEMAKMEYLNYQAAKVGAKASPEKDDVLKQMEETNTDALGTVAKSVIDVISFIGIPKTLNVAKLKKSASSLGRMPGWIKKAESFSAHATGPLLKFVGRMKPWLSSMKKLLVSAYKIEEWTRKILDAYGNAKKFLVNTGNLAKQIGHGAGTAYSALKRLDTKAIGFVKHELSDAKSFGASLWHMAGNKASAFAHFMGNKAQAAVQGMLPHFGGDGTKPLMASSTPGDNPKSVADGGMTGPFYPKLWAGRTHKTTESALNDSSNVAVYVNGVQTPLDRHIKAAQELAQQIGKPVVGIYNASGTPAQDFGQSATDKSGILGLGKRNAAINTLAKVIGLHGSPTTKNGGLDLYAHSQGSIIVSEAIHQAKGAGHDVRGVDVTTFGNAAWSRPAGVRGYHNYAYDSDPIATMLGSTSAIGALLRTPFNHSNPLNPVMGGQGMVSTADDTFTLHHRGAGARPHGVIPDDDSDNQDSYIKSLLKFRAKEQAVRKNLTSLGPTGGALAGEALNRAMVTRSLEATGFALAKGAGGAAAGQTERGYNAASGIVGRGYESASHLFQAGYEKAEHMVQQGYAGASHAVGGAYSEGADAVASKYGQFDKGIRHLPSMSGLPPNAIWGALDQGVRKSGTGLDSGLRGKGVSLDHTLKGLGRTTDKRLRRNVVAADDTLRLGGKSLDHGLRRMGTGVTQPGKSGADAVDDYFDSTNVLQRKGKGTGDHPDVNPAALRSKLRKQSAGFAPDTGIRTQLSKHLGFDPVNARLHNDPVSAEAARTLHAEAFTIGNDIFFGEGKFDPHTPQGLGLIAHELTHVGQQTGTTGNKTSFYSEAGGDQMERDAQQTGAHVLANAGSRNGLFIEDYVREYEGEVSLSNQQRLDRISVRALEAARKLLGKHGLTGIKADALEVEIEINLSEMSDAKAAKVWAEAIIEVVSKQKSSRTGSHTDAIQRDDTPPGPVPEPKGTSQQTINVNWNTAQTNWPSALKNTQALQAPPPGDDDGPSPDKPGPLFMMQGAIGWQLQYSDPKSDKTQTAQDQFAFQLVRSFHPYSPSGLELAGGVQGGLITGINPTKQWGWTVQPYMQAAIADIYSPGRWHLLSPYVQFGLGFNAPVPGSKDSSSTAMSLALGNTFGFDLIANRLTGIAQVQTQGAYTFGSGDQSPFSGNVSVLLGIQGSLPFDTAPPLSGVQRSPLPGAKPDTGTYEHAAVAMEQAVAQGKSVHSAMGKKFGVAGSATAPIMVQRSPEDQPHASPVWHVPFELGDAADHAKAALMLVQMLGKFEELKDTLPDDDSQKQIKAQQDFLMSQAQKMTSGEGALTQDEVNQLAIGTGLVKAQYDVLLETMKARVVSLLSQMFTAVPEDPQVTAGREADLAEALHDAYQKTTVTDRVKQISAVLTSMKEYDSQAGDMAGKAKQGADLLGMVKTAKKLEGVNKLLGQAKDYLGKSLDVLDKAGSVLTLLGADNQLAGDGANTISRARAGFELVDWTVGKLASEVPIVGALWTDYYKPAIDACLKGIEKLLPQVDYSERMTNYLMWAGNAEAWKRGSNIAPLLPSDPLTLSHFPGGQPVLDLMFQLVNEGDPKMTPAAQTFFIKQHTLFSAAGIGEIAIQSNWHLLSPSTYGDPDSAPNLLPWLQKNKDTVWAMLYGSIPHTCR